MENLSEKTESYIFKRRRLCFRRRPSLNSLMQRQGTVLIGRKNSCHTWSLGPIFSLPSLSAIDLRVTSAKKAIFKPKSRGAEGIVTMRCFCCPVFYASALRMLGLQGMS